MNEVFMDTYTSFILLLFAGVLYLLFIDILAEIFAIFVRFINRWSKE